MTGRAFDWTDERVETLRKLWKAGTSASLIARELVGTTRCGVLGKLHRLGLSGPRTKPKMRLPASGNKTPRKPAQKVGAITGKPVVRKPATIIRATVDTREPLAAPPRMPKKVGASAARPEPTTPVWPSVLKAEARAEGAFVAPTRNLVAFNALRPCQCKWIFGDKPDYLACGLETEKPEGSYCEAHQRISRQAGTNQGPTTARKMREVRAG